MIRTSGLFVLVLCLLLAACASRPPAGGPDRRPDGAPRKPPDLSRIADPVPRVEPRSRYGNPASYVVFGRTYHVMQSAHGFRERGIASWYGTKFHGRRTSSGEPYDMYAMTAAHKTIPLPSYVRVTNLRNGRQVIVRVNDRGPFAHNRIIDLSYAAAHRLDMIREGTAPVEIEVLATPGMPATLVRQTELSPRASVLGNNNINYYIQAASFSDRSNAERLRARLANANLGAGVEIQTAELPRGPVYRVRIGPVRGVEQVDRLTARLSEFDIASPQVIVQ